MLTGRKRGERSEIVDQRKKALSLRIGNESAIISEPADQRCISRISSTGRMAGYAGVCSGGVFLSAGLEF